MSWTWVGNAEVDQPVSGSRACESWSDLGGQMLTGSTAQGRAKSLPDLQLFLEKGHTLLQHFFSYSAGFLPALGPPFLRTPLAPHLPPKVTCQPFAGYLLVTVRKFALVVKFPLWFLRPSVCQSSWSWNAAQQTCEGVRAAETLRCPLISHPPTWSLGPTLAGLCDPERPTWWI